MIADILLAENMVEPGLSSRHILQETVTTTNHTKKFFNNSCVLLHMKSMKLTSKNNNGTELITPGAGSEEWIVNGCGSNSVGCR